MAGDSTGTIAGNRHYLAGTIEGPLLLHFVFCRQKCCGCSFWNALSSRLDLRFGDYTLGIRVGSFFWQSEMGQDRRASGFIRDLTLLLLGITLSGSTMTVWTMM